MDYKRGVIAMSGNRKARYQQTIDSIDRDVVNIQSALDSLNNVWLNNPNPDNELIVAIKNLGAFLALMQRKRVECVWFRDNPVPPPPLID